MADDNNTPTPAVDPRARDHLAYVVLGVGTCGLIGLGALVLALSSDRAQDARLVFGSILPLLGSWIGTVLAYYYSRENLAAATSSVSTLARQLTGMEKLRSIPAKDKMIATERIRSLAPEDLAKLDQQTLAHVLDEMDKRSIGRLVVFDDKKAVKYLIHRSTISELISAQALAGKDVSKLTFKDLVSDPATNKIATTTFTAVGPDATLADAKLAMEQGEDCEDVFVTATGKRDGEVLGWLTDNQISLAARA